MKERRKRERRNWVGKSEFPLTDSNGEVVTSNRRRLLDRRTYSTDIETTTSLQYPLKDSNGELVKGNRRQIVDRRSHSLEIESDTTPGENNNGKLLLTFQGMTHSLSPTNPVVVAGRRKDCDIRIINQYTSREHARFELRDGLFFIVDQSTNGTFLMWEQGDVAHLTGQELPLMGDGLISLGCPITLEDEQLIRFEYQYVNEPR